MAPAGVPIAHGSKSTNKAQSRKSPSSSPINSDDYHTPKTHFLGGNEDGSERSPPSASGVAPGPSLQKRATGLTNLGDESHCSKRVVLDHQRHESFLTHQRPENEAGDMTMQDSGSGGNSPPSGETLYFTPYTSMPASSSPLGGGLEAATEEEEEDQTQKRQLADGLALRRDPVVRRLFGDGASHTQKYTRTPSPPDEEDEEEESQGRQLADWPSLKRDPVIRRLFTDGASHTKKVTRTPSPSNEEYNQGQQLANVLPLRRDPVIRRLFADGAPRTQKHIRTPSPPDEEDGIQEQQLADWPPPQRDPLVRCLFVEGTSHTRTRTRTPSPPDEEHMTLQNAAVDHPIYEDSFNMLTPIPDFHSPVLHRNLPQFLAHEGVALEEQDVVAFPQALLAPLDLDMADFELDAKAMAGFNQMYGHTFDAKGGFLGEDRRHGSHVLSHDAALYAVGGFGSEHSFHWSPTPIRAGGGGSAPERSGSSPTASELGRNLADLSNEPLSPGRFGMELPAGEQQLNIDENLMGFLFDVSDTPLPWLTELAQVAEASGSFNMS